MLALCTLPELSITYDLQNDVIIVVKVLLSDITLRNGGVSNDIKWCILTLGQYVYISHQEPRFIGLFLC